MAREEFGSDEAGGGGEDDEAGCGPRRLEGINLTDQGGQPRGEGESKNSIPHPPTVANGGERRGGVSDQLEEVTPEIHSADSNGPIFRSLRSYTGAVRGPLAQGLGRPAHNRLVGGSSPPRPRKPHL